MIQLADSSSSSCEEQASIDLELDFNPVLPPFCYPPYPTFRANMSRIEVISANAPTEFKTVRCEPAVIRSQEEYMDSTGESTINGFSPTPPSISRSVNDIHGTCEDVHIPHMPLLLRGHAELHLRNGVMRASRLSALHEPDAEKAFFVADLSYVYKQHERWKKCLPAIEPFYGVLYFLTRTTENFIANYC